MPNLFSNQYQNLASKGRFGDTMLAHINPQEAALLKSRGGAGTINPRTGLPEFFASGVGQGVYSLPPSSPEMLPVLAQAFDPDAFKNIADKLQTITVPEERNYGMGGVRPAYEKIAPEFDQYANRTFGGMGTSKLEGYTLPTDQTFQGKPLEAKYDPKGNFQYLTLAGGATLTPDPNRPNIASSPRFNKTGGIVDYGVFDLNDQDGGGFFSGLGDLVSDFGPMIALALGANYLAGSGLFTGAAGAGAATGGLTAAELAAGSTANFMSPALISSAGGAGGAAAASAAGAGLLNSGATTAGGANFLSPEVVANAAGASSATTAATTAAGVSGATTAAGAGSTVTPSMLQSISNATGISVDTLKTFGPSVIQGLIDAGGSALTANQATDAARTQAAAQVEAARIAADAARFRPVGVTTRFGSSNFTTDAAGNVVTAGYTPSAEITGYQDRLSNLANQGLTDVEGARAAYSPLSSAAQNLFSLGQGYLSKTPEQAAQDYISKQTALLAPSRENQLAELRNRQFQTGRSGVATSQGGNLMNTNPEMAAYYNSLAQQDLVLAAQADEEARRRITYGAGLFDTGANLQGRYYTGQTAAYSPFTTAMDTSSGLERLAQQPLDLSTSIGQRVSTANANVGNLTSQGIINAANTMAPANAYSAGGNFLSGAANSPVLANAVNRAFGNTPSTQQTFTFNPATGQYIPVQQPAFVA